MAAPWVRRGRRVQISASAGGATSEMTLTPCSSAACYVGPAGNFTAEIGSETVGPLADRLEALLAQRCDGVRRLHRRVCRLGNFVNRRLRRSRGRQETEPQARVEVGHSG